jgi:hypothetical protein
MAYWPLRASELVLTENQDVTSYLKPQLPHQLNHDLTEQGRRCDVQPNDDRRKHWKSPG